MPAPEVAVNYYTGDDLYLFGKLFIFKTSGFLLEEKTGISHFPYHFPQMNFKLPEFLIQEDLR